MDIHPLPFLPYFHSLSLQAIHRFESTASAVEDITALQDGRLTTSLQAFLSSSLPSSSSKKSKNEKLLVSDPKLGTTLKNLLNVEVVSDKANTEELFRGIRGQLGALLGGVEEKELGVMRLGLGHSLSRWV